MSTLDLKKDRRRFFGIECIGSQAKFRTGVKSIDLVVEGGEVRVIEIQTSNKIAVIVPVLYERIVLEKIQKIALNFSPLLRSQHIFKFKPRKMQ
jgi:hypothetical protein